MKILCIAMLMLIPINIFFICSIILSSRCDKKMEEDLKNDK